MTAAAIKREFEVGRRFLLTNYYITRQDHPCYGARTIVVGSTNTNSVTFLSRAHPERVEKIEWPKAAHIRMLDSGAIAFYGGGAGQGPEDLFVTFEPMD